MRLGRLQRGDHVSIRHLEAGDEAAFIQAVRASRKLHRPWSYLPETAEDFRDMLLRPLGESYLMCRNEDVALVGSASLGHVVFGNRTTHVRLPWSSASGSPARGIRRGT